MSSSRFEKDFWTRVLGEKGLESPGYHEAVASAKAWTEEKKRLKKEIKDQKKQENKKKRRK